MGVDFLRSFNRCILMTKGTDTEDQVEKAFRRSLGMEQVMLVFKAHRLFNHSAPGSRVIKKKKRSARWTAREQVSRCPLWGPTPRRDGKTPRTLSRSSRTSRCRARGEHLNRAVDLYLKAKAEFGLDCRIRTRIAWLRRAAADIQSGRSSQTHRVKYK